MTVRGGSSGVSRAASDTYYLMKDRLGSIINIMDASENLKTTYSYDAFGRRASAPISSPAGERKGRLARAELASDVSMGSNSGQVDSMCRFTGRVYDTGMGNYFYRARYYNQSLGRFFSRDPIFSLASLYAYCHNSPTNFTDPTGLLADNLAGGNVAGTPMGMYAPWYRGPRNLPCAYKKAKMVKVAKGTGHYSKDENGNYHKDDKGDYDLVVYDSDDGPFSDGRAWSQDKDGDKDMSLWADVDGDSEIIGWVSRYGGSPMTGPGDWIYGESLWDGDFKFMVGQISSMLYYLGDWLGGLCHSQSPFGSDMFGDLFGSDPFDFLRGTGFHPDEVMNEFDSPTPGCDLRVNPADFRIQSAFDLRPPGY